MLDNFVRLLGTLRAYNPILLIYKIVACNTVCNALYCSPSQNTRKMKCDNSNIKKKGAESNSLVTDNALRISEGY